MDNWQKFEEKPLSNRESFYSNVNIEGITRQDYKHTENV